MGVLHDYFRAGDDVTAAAVGERDGGPLVDGDAGEPALDGVDGKGIDPAVSLGKLVAFARGVDWDVDIMGGEKVFPDDDDERIMDGPWIQRLGDEARDTLAAIGSDGADALSPRWAAIEEFGGFWKPAEARDAIVELSDLARRAAAAGEHLYCWTSL